MTEIGKHSVVASVHPIFFCVSLMQRYFSKMASGLNCLKVSRAALLMRNIVSNFWGILAACDGLSLKPKSQMGVQSHAHTLSNLPQTGNIKKQLLELT